MAPRGAKPTAHLSVVNGQAAGGRTPDTTAGGRPVKPPVGFVRQAPECPAYLDGMARVEWERIVPELDRLGLLKAASLSSLVAYCNTWALYVKACAERSEGLLLERTITRRDGSTVTEQVKNPAVAIELAAGQQLRQWCSEFGLTPTAEGRLAVPDGAQDGHSEDDDFD